jgi:hypothetical protein
MIIVRCCELSWESALRQKCIWVGRTQIRLLIDVANKALTLRFRFLSIRFTLILGGGAAFPKTPWACPRPPHGLRCGLFGGRSCGRASLATLDVADWIDSRRFNRLPPGHAHAYHLAAPPTLRIVVDN